MTLEEMEAHFRAHPPTNPDMFQAAPMRHDGPWGGHHEPFTIHWALRCACGCDRFEVSIYTGENRGATVSVGPATLRCASCHREEAIFDPRSSGYEAVACEATATIHGPDNPAFERQRYTCGGCDAREFHVALVLHFPDDLFDKGFDDFRGRESELFTWFHLLGFCACTQGKENNAHVILNLECA